MSKDAASTCDLFLAECEFQKELLARRRQAKIDGGVVWMVSPEDLILLKLLAHGHGINCRLWALRQGTLESLEKEPWPILRNSSQDKYSTNYPITRQ